MDAHQLQERTDILEARRPEEMVDLFVADDRVCAHVLEYIRQRDAADSFRIHDVTHSNARPEWLRGVPTIVFRPVVGAGFGPPEGYVGEGALRYLREVIEGPGAGGGHVGADEMEEIEVSGSGGGVNTYEAVYTGDGESQDEADLLQFLLPLRSAATTVGKYADVKVTEDDIACAIAERSRALN